MQLLTVIGTLASVVISAGCGATGGQGRPTPQAPVPVEQLPLPDASGIPSGIYSGENEIEVTVRVGESTATATESQPFNVVIEDGRFLDAAGLPFKVGGTYFGETGTMSVTATVTSITATENRILVRSNLEVSADKGDARGDFSGYQTDTLTYDANTGTLEFVRLMIFGGIASDGTAVNFQIEVIADLQGASSSFIASEWDSLPIERSYLIWTAEVYSLSPFAISGPLRCLGKTGGVAQLTPPYARFAKA